MHRRGLVIYVSARPQSDSGEDLSLRTTTTTKKRNVKKPESALRTMKSNEELKTENKQRNQDVWLSQIETCSSDIYKSLSI